MIMPGYHWGDVPMVFHSGCVPLVCGESMSDFCGHCWYFFIVAMEFIVVLCVIIGVLVMFVAIHVVLCHCRAREDQ